jgi:anti-sigma-K factor RskA
MSNACTDRKDQLLEAALAESPGGELLEHLQTCPSCAHELSVLRARRERMDALLPLVAQGEDVSPGFRARVLDAAESASKLKRSFHLWTWSVGAAAVIVVALLLSFTVHRRASPLVPDNQLAAAQKLAEWQAPSDALLLTPGADFLRATPKLGDSYLRISAVDHKEK